MGLRMQIGKSPDPFSRAKGMAYIMLLIAIAIIGAVAATSLEIGANISRRSTEEHLLWIGNEYETALRTYSAAGGLRRGPNTLDDLLRDPRFPEPHRYLRQLYPDPMTGKSEWGIVKSPDGFIIGVYSLSTAAPIKRSNFDISHVKFENAASYRDWIFGVAVVGKNIAILW